ncbi:putative reverse transcriptase domain-containing protein [Tanacetum coccineum]
MARIMPPRRFKKKSVKRIVEKRVAKAIEEYEKTRVDSNNTGGSGSANTGGTVAPMCRCSYKTFNKQQATLLSAGQRRILTEPLVLKRWSKVFDICTCAEYDKPVTLHDAINMARELIEQGVQAKALRIGDSNKRKWEDQQGNNYHQQQNRRQEAAKVYVAAPAKGRGYAGNLPWCNRCKAHHQPGSCPPRCGKCHKLGHQEGECRTRIPVARDNSLQNVTCFGCGNHGHYRSDCPELKNRN